MNLQVAKLRLTLCDADNPSDVAASKAGSELTELYSASLSFSLNTIPSASISIPFKSKDTGSVKQGKLTNVPGSETWTQYITDRKPVCIKLDVQSAGGIEGLEPGSYIIFKGYIVAISTDYGVKGGSVQLVIQHWLMDLALLPILNRLSSPDNPIDISMESCYNPKDPVIAAMSTSPAGQQYWTPVFEMKDTMKTSNLFESFKGVLNAAASEASQLEERHAGHVSEELYKTVDKALSHVEGQNLAFNPSFQYEKGELLSSAIGQYVLSITRGTLFSITIFDKLVQSFLPDFYMTLVPLVNKAVVIPAPAIEMKQIGETITSDNIVELNVSLSKVGVLAGMVAVASKPLSIIGLSTLKKRTTEFAYPSNGKRKAGVIKACALPPWIENYNEGQHLKVKQSPQFTFCHDTAPQEGTTQNNTAKTEADKIASSYEKLCQAFVKTAYNAECTKQNSALLIANLDFSRVPGQVIKVQLPFSDNKHIYGVINTVGISLSTNSVQATYRLTNVRDEELTKDITSDSGALIYQESWSGEGSLAEKI